ncbi:MAG: putative toxin-antitoxin system toxin component, PIN family [Nitrospinae bacterium]|nr:putative toxin-antitoxin system toxin component, PIN family [Nitrospinota bacterium]
MRVVFDTNIFVSALTFPGGRASEALLKVVAGDVELLVSKAIIHETLDVLARKFARETEKLARVAVYLAELGTMVRPIRRITLLTDEQDNRILECAVSGAADVIVSGDKAILKLGSYHGVRIVTLKEFLETI